MKRCFIKSALFVVGIFLISYLLQVIIYSLIRSTNIGDYGVLNAIDKGAINTEMLVCGSSIAQSHYNPEILSEVTGVSCYNIGLSGSALGVQVPVLKWYLDRNSLPLFLLQNIDIFIGEIDLYIYEPYKYLPYLYNDNLYNGLSRINHRLWVHKYLPMTNLIYFNKDFQRSMILYYFINLKSQKDLLIRGYFPNDRPWMGEKAEKEILNKNLGGIRYVISKTHQEYLKELINICKNRKIQLIFAFSPVKENFMRLEINRKEITDYYFHLCEENSIWFIDLSQSDLSRESNLWVNMTHLKSKGADRFSKELATKIRKKMFSEKKASEN